MTKSPYLTLYKSIASILFLCLLGYLAFQFARVTQFPIGDDPAIHIYKVRTLSYSQLAQEIYPLPLILFKFVGTLTHINYPQLFTVLISIFLFLSGLSLFFFVWKGFGNLPAGIISSLFFVTDRWVNDSLRMGTLGEMFGWAAILLALYALAGQNIWLTLICTAILAFSHPFALTVFLLIFLIYGIVTLFGTNRQEKLFVRNLLIIFVVVGLIAWFVKPEPVLRFLQFKSNEPPGWGERSLWEIFSTDDVRRIFIPFFSIIGLVSVLRYWNKPIVKITYILLLVGLFFSVNHLFGIHFLPFRFYGYLQMAVTLFAGLGVSSIIRDLQFPRQISFVLVLILGGLLAWPNYQINQRYLEWQTTDPHAHAILLPPDREAMDWIKNNTPLYATFTSSPQYGIWISAIGERKNVTFSDVPYDGLKLKGFLASKQRLTTDYIYYSLVQDVPREIKTSYREIYSKDGIVIMKVKNAKK